MEPKDYSAASVGVATLQAFARLILHIIIAITTKSLRISNEHVTSVTAASLYPRVIQSETKALLVVVPPPSAPEILVTFMIDVKFDLDVCHSTFTDACSSQILQY
uniref:Uncharacterized protein n=1 Tax=Glossina brevipalpis TaxID=37001 RepID=A0A1A9W5T0_9MUSC